MEWYVASLLALTLTVDAPPSLASAAARIRAVDQQDLAAALARAGLEMPPEVHVTLVAEGDRLARTAPSYIVGAASGTQEIVIFPARTTRYPYDSLDAVLRHEIVHLALNVRAAGQPLPRWFHEGVATSVEAGWGVTDQLRLLVASLREPEVAEVSRLFRSGAQAETSLAYLLATVLVDDLRQRHGGSMPGRVARAVARGVAFERAFILEAGETPDAAAARAWAAYRQWTNWLPAVTSASAVWTLILVLAVLAFAANRRRRARRRRAWDDESGLDAEL